VPPYLGRIENLRFTDRLLPECFAPTGHGPMKTQGVEARFFQNLAPVSREKPQNPYLAYISHLFSKPYLIPTLARFYNSRRPSKALARVTSSAYSRSPPMGNPKAIRVTFVKGFSKPPIYKVVVSPSTLGLIAKITS